MKNYLIKTNNHLETLNTIFPGMIKNVYVEIFVYENQSKEKLKQIFTRYGSNGINSRSDIVYLDSDCTIVFEFNSGEFVYFGATAGGANFGKYIDDYTIVDNIDDIV